MDRPDKFDDPPASPENRLMAAELRASELRSAMQRWNDRATTLGYEGVAGLLDDLEEEALEYEEGKPGEPR